MGEIADDWAGYQALPEDKPLHPWERRRRSRLRPVDYMYRFHAANDEQHFNRVGPSREWEAAAAALARGPATGTCRRGSPNNAPELMPARAWSGSDVDGRDIVINESGERLYDVWIHADAASAERFCLVRALDGPTDVVPCDAMEPPASWELPPRYPSITPHPTARHIERAKRLLAWRHSGGMGDGTYKHEKPHVFAAIKVPEGSEKHTDNELRAYLKALREIEAH